MKIVCLAYLSRFVHEQVLHLETGKPALFSYFLNHQLSLFFHPSNRNIGANSPFQMIFR